MKLMQEEIVVASAAPDSPNSICMWNIMRIRWHRGFADTNFLDAGMNSHRRRCAIDTFQVYFANDE